MSRYRLSLPVPLCVLGAALAALNSAAPLASAPTQAQGVAPAAGDLVARKQEARLQVAPKEAPTSELLVMLAPGQDARRFAADYGMRYGYSLKSVANAHVFVTASPAAAQQVARPAAADGRVVAVYPNEHTRYERTAFTPNDPYFHKNTPASGWPGQWHLINEWTPGLDARVQGAWNNDITGNGVTIGIVDDDLQISHPDLSPNYVAADSWDFGQNDGDPSPVWVDDNHGTSVAGVAAARGGNGVGLTGAAPLAKLAGLRIDFVNQTTAMFVDGTLYHSSGANTSIKVKNHSYGVGAPYIPAPAETSALQTSAAAGTIHCFAAGNERGGSGQDAGRKQPQSSPDSITVAALGSDGKFASYSNFGACVAVTAPSNSATGFTGITTTDRTTEAAGYNGAGDSFPNPDYTSQFGGTSSATPLVSGVMALVKQAQPALNARFAKHLLALTSDIVDAGDTTIESAGGWKTNAAGFHFNENYGFGLIDAAELVQRATQYSGVTPLATASTGTINVGAAIPDNNATGVSRTFTLSSTTPLEEVQVTLNVAHTYRGDLTAFLTSPSGTTSRLMIQSGSDSTANLSWTFTANAFWGENPAGTWTLNVRDVQSADTGTWNSFAVTVRMGQLQGTTPPPPASPYPAYVRRVYQDLLGRDPDPGALLGWSDYLRTGGSRVSMARAIVNSGEYRTLFVRNLYFQLLRRSADPGGLGFWVDFLNRGGTAEQVQAQLIGSAEYFATRARGTNNGFVVAVYGDVLHRHPDRTGQFGILRYLASGGTRTQVATDILNSVEGRTWLVSDLYWWLLWRDPDPVGLAAWIDQLNRGTRDEELIAAIIASDEYFGNSQVTTAVARMTSSDHRRPGPGFARW